MATILQAFEWYTPGGGRHWRWLGDNAKRFADMGITAVWLPPPTKGASQESTGYDIYDLWDLGEFERPGHEGPRTKYGTRQELEETMKKFKDNGIKIYIDAVLNHKAGADEKQEFKAVPVDQNKRLEDVGEPEDIEGWTRFTFPGRKGKHSDFTWGFEHFTGVDYDAKNERNQIFRIVGDNKGWATDVEKNEGGMDNVDYLMAADIDHAHGDVANDIIAWGKWLLRTFPISGVRLDAVKHFSRAFSTRFVKELREEARKIASEKGEEVDESGGPIVFAVGEEWVNEVGRCVSFLSQFKGEQFSLFDVPLHYRFKEAGDKGKDFDLRSLLDGSLLNERPMDAVTFVDNHDTQPGQALESTVSATFKPLAYAHILLRPSGYPCVFLGDLDGCHAEGDEQPAQPPMTDLAKLVLARKNFAHGELRDYRDHPVCVGWVRMGDEAKEWKNSCAVVMSVGDEGTKRMEIGAHHAGKSFVDILGWSQGEVKVGDDGWAEFRCPGNSVAVWVREDAEGRELAN